MWAYPLSALRKALGASALIDFHRSVNQFGQFYRDDQINDSESPGCVLPYLDLEKNSDGFAAFLDSFRTKAIELLAGKVAA